MFSEFPCDEGLTFTPICEFCISKGETEFKLGEGIGEVAFATAAAAAKVCCKEAGVLLKFTFICGAVNDFKFGVDAVLGLKFALTLELEFGFVAAAFVFDEGVTETCLEYKTMNGGNDGTG